MADIATYKIQFKSDFVLTIHGDAGWAIPFCIKFWTGAPSQAYFVGWDGKEYINCKVDETDASKLIVLFDDHGLPVGQLKMQMAWHTTIADFPKARFDEVMNQMDVVATVEGEEKHVELAFEGETAPEVEYFLPAYANEAQRIANEEQRIENEQQRINQEQQRIANEEGRISAETIRQEHELQRIHNEEARIEEFTQLKADAIEATDAANTAASLANERSQLATDKASLAQAAATLATDKAQLAADKAVLAQAAATLANEKAALAQQKADYAQTKADYAQEQGDYAKEQGDYAKDQGDYAKGEIDGAKGDFPSLGDRFDHVDEISMYFHDEPTPADPDLINEYEACLARAYQVIADLLAVKDVTNESAAAARQAATQTLLAIEQTLNAKNDAERAAAIANDKGDYAKAQGDYAKAQADRLEIAGVFFEEAPL